MNLSSSFMAEIKAEGIHLFGNNPPLEHDGLKTIFR
jgi:hypothetical protein